MCVAAVLKHFVKRSCGSQPNQQKVGFFLAFNRNNYESSCNFKSVCVEILVTAWLDFNSDTYDPKSMAYIHMKDNFLYCFLLLI